MARERPAYGAVMNSEVTSDGVKTPALVSEQTADLRDLFRRKSSLSPRRLWRLKS